MRHSLFILIISAAISSCSGDDPISSGGLHKSAEDDYCSGPVVYQGPDGPYVVKDGRAYTLDGRLAQSPRFLTAQEVEDHMRQGCGEDH